MFGLGGSTTVDFLPSDESRAWVEEGFGQLVPRLGAAAQVPHIIHVPNSYPRDLDGLFDYVCAAQAEIGQRDVEFELVELDGSDRPALPDVFEPLGNPVGQMLHTFHHAGEYAILFLPTVFKVKEILWASIARELGRIGIHRAGGHLDTVPAEEYEADAELAATALGMGAWVANGAYLFENGCCGGGCGVDLKSLRTGLSMPEACYALALDTARKNLPRRAAAKYLAANQKAAFKASFSHVRKQPQLPAALGSAAAPAALTE